MTTKKIKTGTTICELDSILFDVEIKNNPRKTNKEYSKVVTGIIDNEEMDLNYCSDVYCLIKNADIFPNIEQVLFNNTIDFTVEYKHLNNVRFYADYQITDSRYAYLMNGTNDKITPMIRVQHSYNGLTQYKIVFGYFRLVCTNGLTIPIEEMSKFNLCIVGKHTENILHSFEKLNDILVYFANNAKQITKEITAKYELLGGRWVENIEDRIEEVLNATKMSIIDNSKFSTMNDIVNRITTEANIPNLGYNGRVNDFLIYNGINQYLNDDNRNIIAPEIRIEKDSKILQYMIENE